jgi:hypothetical protein
VLVVWLVHWHRLISWFGSMVSWLRGMISRFRSMVGWFRSMVGGFRSMISWFGSMVGRFWSMVSWLWMMVVLPVMEHEDILQGAAMFGRGVACVLDVMYWMGYNRYRRRDHVSHVLWVVRLLMMGQGNMGDRGVSLVVKRFMVR